MNYFLAIFAGILQGVTEFLPVSSSGHLVLFHDILGFDLPDNLTFDVVLHLGTLLALVIFFKKEIFLYVRALLLSIIGQCPKNDLSARLAWYLVLASIPAALAGYFFENQIKNIFRSSIVVSLMLIIFGILLYLADKFFKKEKNLAAINLKNSLIIGCGQALALVPGVSRSGITIIAGLSQKLKRETAARFSFLLSMPIVFGAGVKKMMDIENINFSETLIYLLGFIFSALTGYFCIKYFLKFLQNNSLKVFAFYRIGLGIIILLIIIIWMN